LTTIGRPISSPNVRSAPPSNAPSRTACGESGTAAPAGASVSLYPSVARLSLLSPPSPVPVPRLFAAESPPSAASVAAPSAATRANAVTAR
jgi:hypothetical protein